MNKDNLDVSKLRVDTGTLRASDLYQDIAIPAQPTPTEPGKPTQVAHPWRAVLRTFVAAAVGSLITWLASIGIDLEALAPAITESITLGLFTLVTGVMTGVLAHPAVNKWVERYLPFLATGAHTEAPTLDSEDSSL